MKIIDLQREVSDADRLSERTRAVLDLANQVGVLKTENDSLRQQIADRDSEIATLKEQVSAMEAKLATLKQPEQEAENVMV